MIPLGLRRIRIIHRLRVLLALVGFSTATTIAATLWWANHTGLPEAWRGGIEAALAANGLHAKVASLRYLPLRGIEISQVVIYSDATHQRILARLDRLLIDVDRSKLSRGDFKVERLDLSGARVSLAVDADDPQSKSLEITDARGRIDFSGIRRLEISGASGMVGGVRLEARAILDLYKPDSTGTPEDAERSRAERRRILLAIIEALDSFELKTTAPPRLSIDARGDLEEPDSLRADLTLRAADLTSRELDIHRLELDGEMRGRTLVVQHLNLETHAGNLNGSLEYHLDDFRGRFELRSDADLPALAQQLGIPLPKPAPSFSSPPKIKAHGSLHRDDHGWHFRVIGDTEITGPKFGHLACDRLTTRFSWDGGRILLEDLEIHDGNHSLHGRAFITPEKVHYQFSTDLPLGFWQNAVSIQPLSDILDDFSPGENAAARIDCRGTASRVNPIDWNFQGKAEATGLAFRGVPTHRARVTMDLHHACLDFTDGEAEFDFSNYRLHRTHGGPDSGSITVDRIRFDNPTKTIEVKQLRGTAWPAPVVRTFAAPIADELEAYRFHRPPTLAADGLIGIESGLPRQNLNVRFSSPAPASYTFLGESLDLTAPTGTVRVLPDRVQVRKLNTRAFDGGLRADFDILLDQPQQQITGEFDWTDLHLPAIARTYQFETAPKGTITGRIDFSLTGDQPAGLNGHGHLALEDGELFEVPIFGPLSPLIAAVLGQRKAGFQEATDAFFTFEVADGVIATTDFLTTTPSLVFTGDGQASLPQETLDFTIRMNARGLFGFITLPLRPFYGLFQFRGSGPIQNPEWKNVIFTSPPPEQKNRLLNPPKAHPVADPDPSPPRAIPATQPRR